MKQTAEQSSKGAAEEAAAAATKLVAKEVGKKALKSGATKLVGGLFGGPVTEGAMAVWRPMTSSRSRPVSRGRRALAPLRSPAHPRYSSRTRSKTRRRLDPAVAGTFRRVNGHSGVRRSLRDFPVPLTFSAVTLVDDHD